MTSQDQPEQALQAFLNGTASSDALFSTTARLVEPVRKAFQEQATAADDLPLARLWDPLILAARKAAYTQEPTPAHAAVIALLANIKAAGVLTRDSDQTVGQYLGQTLWSELPGFGMQMREAWNSSPPDSSTEEWESLNAFAARCTAAGVEDFSLYAIWALREALETKWPTAAELDQVLPAAVAWIDVYGAGIVKHSKAGTSFAKGGNAGDPARPGPLAKDAGVSDSGFSVARWKFWLRRLGEIGATKDDTGGRQHAAKVAHRGLIKMEALDQLAARE